MAKCRFIELFVLIILSCRFNVIDACGSGGDDFRQEWRTTYHYYTYIVPKRTLGLVEFTTLSNYTIDPTYGDKEVYIPRYTAIMEAYKKQDNPLEEFSSWPVTWNGMGEGYHGFPHAPWAWHKEEEPKPAICFEETSFGLCKYNLTRYAYNPYTKTCHKFRYSGCLGNLNNFTSMKECYWTCITILYNPLCVDIPC